MKVYNAEGMILGRVASIVAKQALLGEQIAVVNCDKAIVSGKVAQTFALEKKKRDRRGYPLKSQKYSHLPDRYVRRTIRGMLPWKQTRGREAFKRVMCYAGVPEEFAQNELLVVEGAKAAKLPTLNRVNVGEVCKYLGWKGL